MEQSDWRIGHDQIEKNGDGVDQVAVPGKGVEFCAQNRPKSDRDRQAHVDRKCVQDPGQLVEPPQTAT